MLAIQSTECKFRLWRGFTSKRQGGLLEALSYIGSLLFPFFGGLWSKRGPWLPLCFPHSVSQPSSLALQPLLPTLKSAMPVRRNGSNAWVHPLLSSPVRLGIFVCFYIICHFSSWRQWQGWLVQIACAMQEVGALIYLMLLKHLQTTKQISSFYLFQRD